MSKTTKFNEGDNATLTVEVRNHEHVTMEMTVNSDEDFVVKVTTYERMNPDASGRMDTFQGHEVTYEFSDKSEVHALLMVMLDDFNNHQTVGTVEARLFLPNNVGLIKSKTVVAPTIVDDMSKFLLNAVTVVGAARLITSKLTQKKGLLLH